MRPFRDFHHIVGTVSDIPESVDLSSYKIVSFSFHWSNNHDHLKTFISVVKISVYPMKCMPNSQLSAPNCQLECRAYENLTCPPKLSQNRVRAPNFLRMIGMF